MKKVLCMILLTILLGCTHQDENVIKIGAAGPMTGDQSKMGVDLRNAVELAVAEWNARGGVLGKKIVMLAGDDQADPKQAVSIANKFINQKDRGRGRPLEFKLFHPDVEIL